MSGSYPLPTEPEGIVAPLLKRFQPGEISAMMPPYDAEAVFIASRREPSLITPNRRPTPARSHGLSNGEGQGATCVRCWRYCRDRAGLFNCVAQVTTASTCTSGLGDLSCAAPEIDDCAT